jgi:hypothetical protein
LIIISLADLCRIEGQLSLTVKLANRYIMRSLRCLIAETLSAEAAVELCGGLDKFTAPLGVGEWVGRWVMGLVPWVHADLAGGFLQVARSALRQVQVNRVVSKKEHCGMR